MKDTTDINEGIKLKPVYNQLNRLHDQRELEKTHSDFKGNLNRRFTKEKMVNRFHIGDLIPDIRQWLIDDNKWEQEQAQYIYTARNKRKHTDERYQFGSWYVNWLHNGMGNPSRYTTSDILGQDNRIQLHMTYSPSLYVFPLYHSLSAQGYITTSIDEVIRKYMTYVEVGNIINGQKEIVREYIHYINESQTLDRNNLYATSRQHHDITDKSKDVVPSWKQASGTLEVDQSTEVRYFVRTLIESAPNIIS